MSARRSAVALDRDRPAPPTDRFRDFAGSLVALWDDAGRASAAGRRPPEPRSVAEGFRYARSRPTDGHVPRRHQRDVLRHADGAFPGHRGELRRRSVGLLDRGPRRWARPWSTLTSGWTKHVQRHGLAVVSRPPPCGAGNYSLSGSRINCGRRSSCLSIAGGADMVSRALPLDIWGQTIPDHLRGRLAGIEMVSYTTGPMLGNAEAGDSARLFRVRASVVSGGVLCVAGTLLLAAVHPVFINYDGSEGLRRKQEEEEARAATAEESVPDSRKPGASGSETLMKHLRLPALVLLMLCALAAYYYHAQSTVARTDKFNSRAS